jgi:hypothetical protein
MNRFKYFTVQTTTIVKAPALEQVRKQLPPFIQASMSKRPERITVVEKSKEQS